jgi:hypothetical protein
MASSHGTDRVTTRHDLCNNRGLVFVVPLPPTTSSGEDFQSRTGFVVALCTVSILSPTVESNRRLADQHIIRKVAAEHCLPCTNACSEFFRLSFIGIDSPHATILRCFQWLLALFKLG